MEVRREDESDRRRAGRPCRRVGRGVSRVADGARPRAQAHARLVVDGAWLLPSFVTGLELPDTEVRSVYVVQRTEADVEAALIPRRGGLLLEHRHRLMNRRIFPVRRLAGRKARAHDLPVVEALPFESLLDRARAALSRTERSGSMGAAGRRLGHSSKEASNRARTTTSTVLATQSC